jgi:hypothetical protein
MDVISSVNSVATSENFVPSAEDIHSRRTRPESIPKISTSSFVA